MELPRARYTRAAVSDWPLRHYVGREVARSFAHSFIGFESCTYITQVPDLTAVLHLSLPIMTAYIPSLTLPTFLFANPAAAILLPVACGTAIGFSISRTINVLLTMALTKTSQPATLNSSTAH